MISGSPLLLAVNSNLHQGLDTIEPQHTIFDFDLLYFSILHVTDFALLLVRRYNWCSGGSETILY